MFNLGKIAKFFSLVGEMGFFGTNLLTNVNKKYLC